MRRALTFLALAVLSLSGCYRAFPAVVATAIVTAAIVSSIPPPPPRVEAVPPLPPGYVWQPGYWTREGGEWVWVPGHWVAVQGGYVWVPAHWEQFPDGTWRLIRGRWVPPPP